MYASPYRTDVGQKLTTLSILAAIAILGYLAIEFLLPVLPHGFPVKWYEAAIVLVGAGLGIAAVRTEVLEDLLWDAGPLAIVVGSVTGTLLMYFGTTPDVSPIHWEILTVGLATIAAFILGALGEWLTDSFRPY